MGSIYQPNCQSCNYNFQNILVGVGMRGPENHYGPVACYHCHRLYKKNLNADNLSCSKCRKEIAPLKGFGVGEQPSYGEKHICPKCGEKALELLIEGYWD